MIPAERPRPAGRLLARWVLLTIALIGALCVVRTAEAAGEERTTIGNDLNIHTDTRWCGGVWGGYYPIRVQVVNRGEGRNLPFEVRSAPPTQELSVVRTVGAEQNATIHFTLAVPLLAMNYAT